MRPAAPVFLPTTARQLALWVLLNSGAGQPFAPEVLDAELQHGTLSPVDRRLATQLVYGTLRRRGTLDALVRPLIRPGSSLEPWLMDVLRLGAYQLALLDQIPPHAAVHESVELAQTLGRPGAKGIINAILRRMSAVLTDDTLPGPSTHALPLGPGRYRRLLEPVFPDPQREPILHLASAFSLPRWLVERWLPRHGWERCVELGLWFAGPARLWLRVNTLHTSREAYLQQLQAANVRAEAGPEPASVVVLDSASVRELPGYAAGVFSVQDVSAQAAARALQPTPGMRLLDLCAAPGGKTTHLAELLANRGQIIACDVDDVRLDTVRTLAERLRLTCIRPTRIDPEGDPPAGPFDAALVDVPCSNTGVLGRRPEARWRLRPVELPALVRMQTRLLLLAAERVRPGGAIVYSTCSYEPDENQAVVQAACQGLRGLTLEAECVHVPGAPGDGGYWARLRR
jgi:16S rRNA (cytosine967-C5)-methyltransferase